MVAMKDDAVADDNEWRVYNWVRDGVVEVKIEEQRENKKEGAARTRKGRERAFEAAWQPWLSSRSRHYWMCGCGGVGKGAVYVALFARRPINTRGHAPLGHALAGL